MFTGSIGDWGNNRIRDTQDNCPGGNSQYTCKETLATKGQNIGTDDTKTLQRTKETAKQHRHNLSRAPTREGPCRAA